MSGADDLLVKAREALLDALDALSAHRDAIVLVGGQAIYLHTGQADVPIATTTKDSDLLIDPALLGADPLLEEAMTRAGFHRNLQSGQPGEWLDSEGIPVDLLVPATLVPAEGRRSVQMPPHSRFAARKVLGLEAAVVDHGEHEIASLLPGGGRSHRVNVAGPAALAVAKLHKLGERARAQNRLVDKDAHDYYRLLRATETEQLGAGFVRLLAEERCRDVTRRALEYMSELFSEAAATGVAMAGRAEAGIGDPAAVAAAASALTVDLLAWLDAR
ncbi:MAG TPA: GSU2403 family nucleotidyltransferase fold protein [Solirubrobacteraceae bacterium]|nr:GSU2403 family nucleotidyltransferase fold protein [Solirubrobacteraceae bacterium]